MKNKNKNQNFVLLRGHSKNRISENWRVFLIMHLFEHYIIFSNDFFKYKQIEWKTSPPYFNINEKFLNFIGKWFRLIVFIFSSIPFLTLIFNAKNTIPYYIFLTISIILMFPALSLFLYDIAMKIRVKTHIKNINVDSPVTMYCGPWGAGKTSSMVYESVLKAKKQWKYLCREYKKLRCRKDEIQFWSDSLKKNRALEIIESYEFYKKSNTVPCLWTTIPVFVNGISSNKLTGEHLVQEKKLPYNITLCMDEISMILPQNLYKKNNEEIDSILKFGRQFFNGKFSQTEQAKQNEYCGLRRVTTSVQFMTRQKWVLKPNFILWLINFITDKKKKIGLKLEIFLRELEEVVKNIGYRKCFYKNLGTEYFKEISKEKNFIAPSNLNLIKYDDRAFVEGYLAKDKNLEVSKFDSLTFSREEILKTMLPKKYAEIKKCNESETKKKSRKK